MKDKFTTLETLAHEVRAHRATRVVLRRALECEALMHTQLTITQARCTELLLELRKYGESKALPGLGWDCRACGAFNGAMKEELTACRCCDVPRPA